MDSRSSHSDNWKRKDRHGRDRSKSRSRSRSRERRRYRSPDRPRQNRDRSGDDRRDQHRSRDERRERRTSDFRKDGGSSDRHSRRSPNHVRSSPDDRRDSRHDSDRRNGSRLNHPTHRDSLRMDDRKYDSNHQDRSKVMRHDRQLDGDRRDRSDRESEFKSGRSWDQLRSDRTKNPQEVPQRRDFPRYSSQQSNRTSGEFWGTNESGERRGWGQERRVPDNWRAGRVGPGHRGGGSYRGPDRFATRRGGMGAGGRMRRDEVPSDPTEIPTDGYYFEHDDRDGGGFRSGGYGRRSSRPGFGSRGRHWSGGRGRRRSLSPTSWVHDCYQENQDSPERYDDKPEIEGEDQSAQTVVDQSRLNHLDQPKEEMKYEDIPPSKWDTDTADAEGLDLMEH